MDFQKCNKLSLREKKSFNTILKHLVNQKMIDETFANEGRKIFGIQVGGGSSAEGIHANLNTNTSAKGPEFVEGMDPNQLIRDVAVAATEGMQLIRNASSSGSGGMGGSGGSGADSQSNNIVNAQVNNMQVVLSGIGQGRSAALRHIIVQQKHRPPSPLKRRVPRNGNDCWNKLSEPMLYSQCWRCYLGGH